MGLTAFSLEPPPKKAIDSACVRSLECMNLEKKTHQINALDSLNCTTSWLCQDAATYAVFT